MTVSINDVCLRRLGIPYRIFHQVISYVLVLYRSIYIIAMSHCTSALHINIFCRTFAELLHLNYLSLKAFFHFKN